MLMTAPRVLLFLSCVLCLNAQLLTFTDSPATNTADWTAQATTDGSVVDATVDFAGHPLGPLDVNFYAPAITMSVTGGIQTIVNFASANTNTNEQNTGEGVYLPSENLLSGGTGGTFSMAFASDVCGVGIQTHDLFQTTSFVSNTQLEAFDSAASSLGTATSIAPPNNNFQSSFIYFMGVIDPACSIRSVTFTHPGAGGDQIGIDNILIARPAAAVASGDPHLRGPHGEKYDFFGKPNSIYSLFSTPQFDVNMKLFEHGPKARFINEIGVVFRNVTIRFDTYNFSPVNKEKHLNALLKAVGGRAEVSPYTIELELCTGHRLTIVQRVDVDTIQKKKHTYYHLDIQIQVPGCHDSYDGALGQTYQCKYSKGEKFTFSHDDEEKFHVKHLFSTSGSFSSTAPCHEMDVFNGQQPAIGGSMDSAKMTERASMGAIEH